MKSEPRPATQHAIQLVGPGRLRHNPAKPVPDPGPCQILARVEAVGLCFSDLKLLKQFSGHARKGAIVAGMDGAVLETIPSYVPGEAPTVPGHEVCCRIVAAGEKVSHYRVGERCLVQTDYRALKTKESNAAFGYNFEGGLQEYVLMDERIVVDPESGERFLIPVGDDLGASAVALVEPWACVENSYVDPERRQIKAGGRLLVVADEGHRILGLEEAIAASCPASAVVLGSDAMHPGTIGSLQAARDRLTALPFLPDESFDDIVYFGADCSTIETLSDKVAARGIVNIVTAGRKLERPVSIGIGRIHYGMTRWIGTAGGRADESYRSIPASGEIRRGERIAIIGAGGPMGQMHVIRNIRQGIPEVSITAADIDDVRLQALARKAVPIAGAAGLELRLLNTGKASLGERFSYFVLMAPVAGLVADAVRNSLPGCIINVFAGIPPSVRAELDLNTYIANRCYLRGTSGSVVRDMRIVLEKIARGRLDTDTSVEAVAGMAGAMAGIAALEKGTFAGKIIVYPELHDLGLVPLQDLARLYPSVSEKLSHGNWTRAAEEELLRIAGDR